MAYSYHTEFILNKDHFNECFDNSVNPQKNITSYFKALVFFIICIAIFFSNINLYFSYFFLGLSIIEALSVYYRKKWWVMRQMLGKSANHTIKLQLDDEGITIISDVVNEQLLWENISDIDITDQGLLITHQNKRQYISQRCLSIEALTFITSHRKKFNKECLQFDS